MGTIKIQLHRILPVVMAGIIVSISCSDSKNDPSASEESSNSLEVQRFESTAGEMKEFSGNYEIHASESIDIAGDLVIKPTEGGDFTLRLDSGTIRITGSIYVDRAARKLTRGERNKSATNQTRIPAANRGTSINVVIEQPGGVIDLSALGGFIGADDASDQPDGVIGMTNADVAGDDGKEGGSILLRAPGGTIILPPPPGSGLGPVFYIGKGGDGQSITVDREGFTTTATNVSITGGRGGKSGALVLEADIIENRPDLDDIGPNYQLISGGEGGAGGNVLWENTDFSITSETGGELERKFPLQEIWMHGGRGGDGALTGGNGGFAVYWSGRAIHERGEIAPPVHVYGGDGGDVFPSQVPAILVQGGDGGSFAAWGNAGIEGGVPSGTSLDGTTGGRVFGHGGNGGRILKGVLFHDAIGGGGGHTEVAQAAFVNELGVIYSSNYQYFAYGISSIGGEGGDSCDGCPGGNAGPAGFVMAIGGNGGDVPFLEESRSRGGRGGDVWYVGPLHADGGNGNPPGRGACTSGWDSQKGTGGDGDISGADGTVIDILEASCGSDGTSCGEGLECVTGGGLPVDCWTQPGASFTAEISSSQSCPDTSGIMQTSTTTHSETGTYTCSGDPENPGGCVWSITGTKTTSAGGGSSTISYGDSFNGLQLPRNAPATAKAMVARCIEGGLYFPGSAHSRSGQSGDCSWAETWKFGGCNPALMSRNNPGEWKCCPRGPKHLPFGGDCSP